MCSSAWGASTGAAPFERLLREIATRWCSAGPTVASAGWTGCRTEISGLSRPQIFVCSFQVP
jgi:hypothetical protein